VEQVEVFSLVGSRFQALGALSHRKVIMLENLVMNIEAATENVSSQ